MGCIYDYPLDPYICDINWNYRNCVECPNWIDESEESESQAESEE